MVSPTVLSKGGPTKESKVDVEYEPLYLDTVETDDTYWMDSATQILKRLLMFVAFFTFLLSIQVTSKFNKSPEMVRYESMFDDFIVKYDRNYDTAEELEYRFQVFMKNVQEFEEYEKEHPGIDLDVTQFADWTDYELTNLLKSSPVPEFETARFSGKLYKDGESRPASIDWRDQGKLTAVKNQAQCGSCWAFATVGAVEAQHAIKKGELVSLSEQEMVDCDHRNNGCHGGYRPYAMNFVKRNGLEREKEYPYTGIETDQCRLKENLTRVFIDDYEMLSQNEDAIADWVATRGPVTFGMAVVKSMYSYRSGIFNPSEKDCKENAMGSHALVIVGYGTENNQSYWVVKNSWGTWWGDKGYFRLARGVNSCGAANTVVAPVIN